RCSQRLYHRYHRQSFFAAPTVQPNASYRCQLGIRIAPSGLWSTLSTLTQGGASRLSPLRSALGWYGVGPSGLCDLVVRTLPRSLQHLERHAAELLHEDG